MTDLTSPSAISLSDIGDVYAWGWNESGQVGLACNKLANGEVSLDRHTGCNFAMYPVLLFYDQEDLEIEKISSGSRHSLALSSKL